MSTLSVRDKRILAAVQIRADDEPIKLARELKLREHVIRRALTRIRERGIAERYPFINVFPLGYGEAGVFFSLACKPSVRAKILQRLLAHDRVSWVLEFAGSYQYGAAICVRRASEIARILDEVAIQSADVFVEKSIALRTGWYLFPRKYLGNAPGKERYLSCVDTGAEATIDELDHRLLELMSGYDYGSKRELARELGVSHTCVLDRLKHLEAKNVLRGYAYGIDASLLGMQVYRLLVHTRGGGKKLRDGLFAFCEKHPAVVAFIECVGTWDFEIKVEVATAEELSQLLHLMYEQFDPSIQEIKSLAVLKVRKLEFYPFRGAQTPQPKRMQKVRHFD